MPPTIQQQMALDEELRTSVRLIRAGLGSLQSLSGGNDFYHLPMITLSSGFERLMKLIICLGVLHRTGDFPTCKEFKRRIKGHNLEVLLQQILDKYFDPSYTNRVPAAHLDASALQTDPKLRQMVAILSRFGQSARYYHLDVISGLEPQTQSPKHEWERLETEILLEGDDWEAEIKQDPNLSRSYDRISRELVLRLERLARALCRLFTLGDLGSEAQRYTTTIAPFLSLRDEDLGTRDYRPYLSGNADDL